MNSDFINDLVNIVRGRNIWRIENALIEEVDPHNKWSGHLIISYNVRGTSGLLFNEHLRLNVTPRTIIRNEQGRVVSIGDLQVGMRINADFLPFMTASEPPETNALRIVVRQSEQPKAPTITDRIVAIDGGNRMITVGTPNDIYSQNIFIITDETQITDQNGRQIPLRSLRIGQTVKVTHAISQTFSIPPQSVAFTIQSL